MKQQLVVVGNGMAGVACVEEILKYKHDFEITIFGDETHVNYNRILLSCVLAGEKAADEIVLNDIDWYQSNGIRPRLGVRIDSIDSIDRTLTGSDGSVTPYDKLIIATGSSAFVPPIPGVDKRNVHVFRTLDLSSSAADSWDSKLREACKHRAAMSRSSTWPRH
jgi:nitrite reductase [NAD(P)H] large subunit